MIRLTALRRPHAQIPTPGWGLSQRRSKMFRRVTNPDDPNETYYKLRPRRGKRGMPNIRYRTEENFQITDLLLDLDDVDSKIVRPFTEEDEERLLKKWSADPAKDQLEARISEMQTNLNLSRQKGFEIATKPANAWQVTNHDILSVALRGPPTPAPSSEQNSLAKEDTLKAREALDPRRGPDPLHKVCFHNGVSNYALQKDQLLLHWLGSRRAQSFHSTRETRMGAAPTWDQFGAALGEETSIEGIRRLVFLSLSSGMNATWFQAGPDGNDLKPPYTLSNDVRDACMGVIDHLQTKEPSWYEGLAFLGSLRKRLSSHYEDIGGPLCGLGLRLSADLANPETTVSYLGLGFKHKIWAAEESLDDVLYTIKRYSHYLKPTTSKASTFDISEKANIFGMLTGIGEEDNISAESIRTLALFCMHGRRQTNLYRAYIKTLGQLGAVATLWKERHLIRDQRANQKAQQVKGLQEQDWVEVDRDFAAAVRAALSVVARREYAVPEDLGLVDCAMLDLETIEMESDEAGLGNQGRVGPIKGLKEKVVLGVLDLPLDGWLREVRAVAARTANWSAGSKMTPLVSVFS